ncbi:hypothetical protein DY000_02010279 [Brassica cretica]|uniref:Uncharacterized protein n=1 Tax=Brassica cretica TaxID=69181 RepID=A0ABQ7BZH9_BRACR|nr:hypothetical protein DY000_02010279 [Brassica cretica]
MTGAWYRSAGLQECHLQDFATDSFSATFNTVTGPPPRRDIAGGNSKSILRYGCPYATTKRREKSRLEEEKN